MPIENLTEYLDQHSELLVTIVEFLETNGPDVWYTNRDFDTSTPDLGPFIPLITACPVERQSLLTSGDRSPGYFRLANDGEFDDWHTKEGFCNVWVAERGWPQEDWIPRAINRKIIEIEPAEETVDFVFSDNTTDMDKENQRVYAMQGGNKNATVPKHYGAKQLIEAPLIRFIRQLMTPLNEHPDPNKVDVLVSFAAGLHVGGELIVTNGPGEGESGTIENIELMGAIPNQWFTLTVDRDWTVKPNGGSTIQLDWQFDYGVEGAINAAQTEQTQAYDSDGPIVVATAIGGTPAIARTPTYKGDEIRWQIGGIEPSGVYIDKIGSILKDIISGGGIYYQFNARFFNTTQAFIPGDFDSRTFGTPIGRTAFINYNGGQVVTTVLTFDLNASTMTFADPLPATVSPTAEPYIVEIIGATNGFVTFYGSHTPLELDNDAFDQLDIDVPQVISYSIKSGVTTRQAVRELCDAFQIDVFQKRDGLISAVRIPDTVTTPTKTLTQNAQLSQVRRSRLPGIKTLRMEFPRQYINYDRLMSDPKDTLPFVYGDTFEFVGNQGELDNARTLRVYTESFSDALVIAAYYLKIYGVNRRVVTLQYARAIDDFELYEVVRVQLSRHVTDSLGIVIYMKDGLRTSSIQVMLYE